MSFRECDACGYKLPLGRRRNRVGDQLVCDGCCPDKPGKPHMPLGANASLNRCEECDAPMTSAGLIRRESKLVCGGGCIAPKVAHESPDGVTVAHCPFCGSGQVTGRSDGGIECSMCDRVFSVKVAPEFSAIPQTPEAIGQDLEPEPGDPQSGEHEADLGGDQDGDGDQDEESAEDAPEDSEGDPEDDEGDEEKLKSESGFSLRQEDYLRHVALQISLDRDSTIQEIRGSK